MEPSIVCALVALPLPKQQKPLAASSLAAVRDASTQVNSMASPINAFICGVAGTELSEHERLFLSRYRPFGVILFARNCNNPAQVKALVADIRSALNHPLVTIYIDQEGGRVARLKPPHWRAYPAAEVFASLADSDLSVAERATYVNARLIAHDLHQLGINVNCAPLADIPAPGSHSIIGDRAFGRDVNRVVALARAQAKGLHDGGVMTVLKHIPGHGRANADSHEALPVVETPLAELEATDFATFKALADLPMGMTAHVLFTAIDPNNVATLSASAIRLIRKDIGFDGVLMSDDVSMKALKGDMASLANAIWDAGCDIVLHCNGNMDEMQAIANVSRPLEGKALERCERAFGFAKLRPDTPETLIAEIDRVMPGLYAA
ncbi:MAG: beta-N-acetylhexosaminidase [Alphaproteobacteria bacterium]|nr:beta-N-acetylhexosaminidase [Alphaproteobacteria bacterium]